MISNRGICLFILLSAVCFISSVYLVLQIFDFRVSFSEIEKLNKNEENLSFQANFLLSEVEHYRNQLTIRKIATESLGMSPPLKKLQVFIYLKEKEL